jgi:hypothetical protein
VPPPWPPPADRIAASAAAKRPNTPSASARKYARGGPRAATPAAHGTRPATQLRRAVPVPARRKLRAPRSPRVALRQPPAARRGGGRPAARGPRRPRFLRSPRACSARHPALQSPGPGALRPSTLAPGSLGGGGVRAAVRRGGGSGGGPASPAGAPPAPHVGAPLRPAPRGGCCPPPKASPPPARPVGLTGLRAVAPVRAIRARARPEGAGARARAPGRWRASRRKDSDCARARRRPTRLTRTAPALVPRTARRLPEGLSVMCTREAISSRPRKLRPRKSPSHPSARAHARAAPDRQTLRL